MNKHNTGSDYSQHAEVAPQTRKLHDHLIRKQHGRGALALLAGAVVLALIFAAVLYLPGFIN